MYKQPLDKGAVSIYPTLSYNSIPPIQSGKQVPDSIFKNWAFLYVINN